MRWRPRVSPPSTLRRMWQARQEERRIVKLVRQQYPTASTAQCLQWFNEDRAFAELAKDVFQAAREGADVSFLWSCPDLTRLAVSRRSQ